MKNKLSFALGSLGVLLFAFCAFFFQSQAQFKYQKAIQTSGIGFHIPLRSSVISLSDSEATVHYNGIVVSIEHITPSCKGDFKACVFSDSRKRNRKQNISFGNYTAAFKQFKYTIADNYELQTATMRLLYETHLNALHENVVVSRYYVIDPGKGMFRVEVKGTQPQKDQILYVAQMLQESFRITEEHFQK